MVIQERFAERRGTWLLLRSQFHLVGIIEERRRERGHNDPDVPAGEARDGA